MISRFFYGFSWVLMAPALISGVSGCGGARSAQDQTGSADKTEAPPTHPSLSRPNPFQNPVYEAVTHEYGPLVVREGVTERESAVQPWASYYFASQNPVLFKDERNSALAKYDRYVLQTRGLVSHARQQEQSLYEHLGSHAESWEGLCNAWSYAAVTYPEPTRKTLHGIDFTVGDLKGLLIKTFESSNPTLHYGVKFREAPGANFESLYPEQFHRFLQVQLFDNGHPFVMDRNPGIQVWNYPVYYAKTEIRPSPHDRSKMQVRALVLAAQILGPDQLDWVTHDHASAFAAFEYTYDLIGTAQPDGSFEVAYGEWTGNAIYAHPDYVIPMPQPQPLIRGSLNSEIHPDIVDEILQAAPGN